MYTRIFHSYLANFEKCAQDFRFRALIQGNKLTDFQIRTKNFKFNALFCYKLQQYSFRIYRANDDELTEELKTHYFRHNLLNHASLKTMHALSRKGKFPSCILLINTHPHLCILVICQFHQPLQGSCCLVCIL